jgi:hypothetical protein
MPTDRAEESYHIYSQLMSGREFRGSGGPRGPWLIADTTGQQHEFAQYQELRRVFSNDALALAPANAAVYKGGSG